MTLEQLRGECRQRNERIVAELREDKHSKLLVDEIRKDLSEGRMTNPKHIVPEDLDSLLLAKRFSVEQGIKEDGSTKIRAIDDETDSGLNLCTHGGHKIKCNNIDFLVRAIHEYSFHAGGFKKLSLWKADVKSAYRRIPIAPNQRWMTWIALLDGGDIKISRHNAMMFGAVGSVLAWDRVGELLATIALKLLRVPSGRWVDDFFCAEPTGTTEHVEICFARLVRALLGQDAVENRKLERGNPLTGLGVDIEISANESTVWPTRDLLNKWQEELKSCANKGAMSSGLASKMAGRLNFAAQNCFKRFGRAMIRPFYEHQYASRRRNHCSPLLLNAVRWWVNVFEKDLHQTVQLKHKDRVLDLFCDASGCPPILAGVVIGKYDCEYFVMKVSQTMVNKFQDRDDNQIMGLELLAILVGLETFTHKLKGASVRIWTDNAGGELALKKQAGKASDHNALVHLVWTKAAEINAGLYINRVPSCENIADGPTRPTEVVSMSIVNNIAAKFQEPKLPRELATTNFIKDCIL